MDAESRMPQPARPALHRRWPWLLAFVLVSVAATLAWRHRARGREHAGASPAPALSVSIVAASRGDIAVNLDALGTVTPLATVAVKSRVNGQIMAVKYREGQMVRQGELLAEIDRRPYQAQLVQAEGQYRRDLALLKGAQVDLVRYQELQARDAIQKQQLDDQAATVQQYEGAVRYDEGQVASAKLNLVYCRITSPIAGRVGLRLVDPGNIVQTTDATGLLVITQLQPITVVFSVAEDFLPQIQRQIRAGQRLPVQAFDRARQKLIASGELLTFDNRIDPATGTVRLKATFANGDEALFPNQFVNARLRVDVHQDATLVPSAVVQRNAQTAFVYLVKPDHTVSVQPVTPGASDGDVTEILKGLEAGDTVASDNFDKLQDGMRVSPRMGVASAEAL